MSDFREMLFEAGREAVSKTEPSMVNEERYDSDYEGFKHEQAIMKADDLRDEWHESGMSLSDFYDDRGW